MPVLSNADIIRIVTKWQECGYFHELTCRIDSRHAALVAVERRGKVVLDCPTCGATQYPIPAAVLGSEAAVDFSTQLDINRVKREEQRQTRRDVWWTFSGVLVSGVFFGSFWFGPIGALAGGAVGTVTAWIATRKNRKKLSRP